MVKLLMLRIFLLLVSIFTLTYASIQTENLGHLNLQPGFAIKLYTSSLRGPGDYHRRPQYFKEKDFLKDSQLIAQNLYDIDMNTCWEPYGYNTLFNFSVDPTVHDFVVEMRGYIKAAESGNLFISTDFYSGYDCNNDFAEAFEGGYWIIKDSISLNETSDGFICSHNSSRTNYAALTFERSCNDDSCGNDDPTFNTVTTVIKDQYYPVVFYTYISGNSLYTQWSLAFNNIDNRDFFDNFAHYDPNDDFEADDASLNSGFPDACPHFHEEVFTATSFVKMSRTDDYNCPTPTSSSILAPSSSSAIQPSSTSSSNSISPSSSEPDNVATSSSITPSSGTKISSADPSSTTSSMTGTSSMSKFQSSRSGTSKPSDLESESESVSSSSQTTKTSSNSESVTSPSSDTYLKSSLSSTAGKPIYTANSTVSHSEHNIPTSESTTAMASSSSFTSETTDGNAILSTATTTESEIDTLTTTTCPETEHPPNTGKTNLLLTSCEETVLPSQESLSNEVTKTTVGPDGVAVTYTECGGCTALQENSSGVSGENNKLSTETADNATPTHSTDIVTVEESALVSGEPVVHSSRSTAVAVQALPGEGQFLTYEPLLLGLSILITFL